MNSEVPGPANALDARVRGLSPSSTLAAQELAAARAERGEAVFRFGLGQSPFPVPTTVVEALRERAAEKDYLPVKGLPALRDALCAYQQRRIGVRRHRDDVLVGPGSKELMFLLQVVFDGELLLPTPAWVSYEPQARILGRRVRAIPCRMDEGFALDPAALDALCSDAPPRARVLLLNDPSNPTGAGLDMGRVRELAAVARRHQLVVLSDEIYAELRFDGAHRSIASLYEEGTILSGGLSKWCGAGGWRLGAFVFPRALRWLCDAMAAVASETYSATTAPVQYAAVRAFEGGPDIDRYLANARRVLAALLGSCARTLEEAGLRVLPARGGFYLFPSFRLVAAALRARGVRNDDELAATLLRETGVVALPGGVFGAPPEDLHLRLALVDFNGARALAAAARSDGALDEAFVREHCGTTIAGVEALARWVREL